MRKFQIIIVGLMLVPAINAKTGPEVTLHQLLANRFGTITGAERRLATAAANGESADCSDLSGADKNIRGEVFRWLCTNPRASAQLTYRGVSVSNAEIVGEVELSWAKIVFPIVATDCTFHDTIYLSGSDLAF